MSDIAQVVGQQIRTLRRSRGLSLEACAERAEMSMTFLGELERGRKVPSLGSLLKLSGAIGVPLSEFIGGLEPDRAEALVSKKELLGRLGGLMAESYTSTEARILCALVGSLRP